MLEGSSVSSDERLRLFVCFPLPGDSLTKVVEWQTSELQDLENVRLVPPANLHITVAFLGSRSASEITEITTVVEEACAGKGSPTFRTTRYRETRSVGTIVFDDEDDRGTIIAGRVGKRLEKIGVYERERLPWPAHVTVLRFRPESRPRARPSLPDLGVISPSEVALYHSVLRSTGAPNEVLETVRL